jgi:hypothetical protein
MTATTNTLSCASSNPKADGYPVGTQLDGHYGKRGFIAAVKDGAANVFVIGSHGLNPVRREYVVVWDDKYVDTLSDGIVAPMVARAAHLPLAENVEARHAAALEAMEQARKARDDATARAAVERAAFEADAIKRIPPWAKAVIVGELIEDQSDSMTDYFGHKTVKSAILGFSRHTRDLFPEMRRAALNHPDTAHLFDAPAEAEHREKYSMGGGYYLKKGTRHGSGWRVEKVPFYKDPVKAIPSGEWALTPPAPKQPEKQAVAAGARIEEHTHTKHGFQMFVVVMAERVDHDAFEQLRAKAKAAGGWWSRRWGSCPSGFAFKDKSAAEQFARGIGANDNAATPPASTGKAERLRGLADKMQADIDAAFRDRLANTPKRRRQADAARIEGARLKRTQDALRALAVAHEAGPVPPVLASLSSRKAVYDLVATRIDTSRAGYYDAGVDTGEPVATSPAAVALWAMIARTTEAEKSAEALRREIADLPFANIPGYFPTPEPIAVRLVDLARIEPSMRVLEPSAGSGDILRPLVRTGATVEAVEIRLRLCNILHGVFGEEVAVACADFLELRPEDLGEKFDRVVMNPPFERAADITHILHALDFLKPSGRLLAICSSGPARSETIRPLSCYWQPLPDGSFKSSGTMANAVLVVIAKDEVDAARADGWRHGGDNGGFWFHGPTWGDDWKAAASWTGTEQEPDGPNAKPRTYDTLSELCEAEELGRLAHA